MCKYAVMITQSKPEKTMVLTFAEQGAARAIVDFVKGSLDPRSTASYIGEVSTMTLTRSAPKDANPDNLSTILMEAYDRALPHRIAIEATDLVLSKDSGHPIVTGTVLGTIRDRVGK